MTGEIKDAKTIPLLASDVQKKIDSFKKHEGLIKDFNDSTISEIRRESESLEKDCSPIQSDQLKALINGRPLIIK